jgi:hypothetical protein
MLQAGLKATVNSDDPAYFGGHVLDNYMAVVEALGLSRAEVLQLTENSLRECVHHTGRGARRSMKSLTGKIVAVIGGSSGMGRATALALRRTKARPWSWVRDAPNDARRWGCGDRSSRWSSARDAARCHRRT